MRAWVDVAMVFGVFCGCWLGLVGVLLGLWVFGGYWVGFCGGFVSVLAGFYLWGGLWVGCGWALRRAFFDQIQDQSRGAT